MSRFTSAFTALFFICSAGAAFAATSAKEKKAIPDIQFTPDPFLDFAHADDCARLFAAPTAAQRHANAKAALLSVNKGAWPGDHQIRHAWSEYESLHFQTGSDFFHQDFLDVLMQVLPNLRRPFYEAAIVEILSANALPAASATVSIQKRRLLDVTLATKKYSECVQTEDCSPRELLTWQLMAWRLGILQGWHKLDFDKGAANHYAINAWFSVFDEFAPGLRERWVAMPVETAEEVRFAIEFLKKPSLQSPALQKIDTGKAKHNLLLLSYGGAGPNGASTPQKLASDEVRPLDRQQNAAESIRGFMQKAYFSATRLRNEFDKKLAEDALDLHTSGTQITLFDRMRRWIQQPLSSVADLPPSRAFLALPKRLELHMLLHATFIVKKNLPEHITRLHDIVFEKQVPAKTRTLEDLGETRFRMELNNPTYRRKFYDNEDQIVAFMNYTALVIRLIEAAIDDDGLREDVFSTAEVIAFEELLRGPVRATGVLDLIAGDSIFSKNASIKVKNYLQQIILR